MPEPNAPFLDVARVRAALAGTRFADVRAVRETGSTNDDAAALLGEPSAAGATLVTDFQRAGKGRKPGRRWLAPPGSALMFTAILPVTVATEALWAVPFWVALAVVDGVEAACGLRLDLRWPNDLDLDGRKAGGILCVSRVIGAEADVACGVGLNVRRPDDAEVAPIVPARRIFRTPCRTPSAKRCSPESSARWTVCSTCSRCPPRSRARGKSARACAAVRTACVSMPTAASSPARPCGSIRRRSRRQRRRRERVVHLADARVIG